MPRTLDRQSLRCIRLPRVTLVASGLLASSLLSACLPIESALRLIRLVAEGQQLHYEPTIVPYQQGAYLLGPQWTIDGLYASPNLGDPPLCATTTGVALAGAWGWLPNAGVLLLDATTGDRVWTETGLGVWHIACAPDAVFIGRGYMVWRRNSQNGQGEWRHWLPVPGDIVHLHAAEGKVYVWTRPNDETTIMDAGTGETQHVASFNDARELLLVRDDAALAGYGALMSFGLDADQPAWRAILSGGIYETPAITNSTIYVRSGEAVGRVYALERSSGEVTWSTAENIRSNLAHTSQGLYVLTDRGELQLLDPLSGQPTTLLQFHPQELPVGLDNGGYYLAASEETGTLYVYLGATYQLMAFQFDSRQLSRPGDPGPTTLPPSNQLP